MIKFNDILDKIGMKELSDDLVVKINNAGQAAITKLNEHINDSTVHVTSTEKDNWNSKAPNNSPNFTGEPTAPTTVQSTNNDQIATTRYVTEKINAWVPDVSNEAKKLVSKNNFSIKGAINSSVQSFDGTGNVVLVVDNVPTKSLSGTIDPLNLEGTYNISITGTAGSANNANSLGGVLAKDFAKLESPTFTGKPKAPTAEAGDSSMQIANTNYVTNAINAIHFPEDVKTAEKLKTPITFKISGKVISNEVAFDGSENVDLKVTTVNIQDQLDAYMPTKVNNHTVDSDVPVNAVFTDTVYTHPDTVQDLTGKSYTQVVVDRQGHVVYGANPDNLAVSIAGNAATATKLANTFKIKLTGDAVTTDATGVTDGQNDATLALDSINANAIATDKDHRLVTDDEKANYLDKYTKAEMDAKLEKFKLDSGFDIIGSSDTEEDIATDFPHPVDGNVVVVKSTGLLYRFNGVSWKCMAEYTLVTKTKNGMMSAVDKVKLDGIEEGANNYKLPDKLPASMITEDETHKFITFDEKTKLDNLYTKDQIDQQITGATPEASVDKAGLLSAADKIKLDSIETGANKYVLPKTLPASIMTEDEEHRFITDTEKASYADKYTKVEVNTLISNATPLASHTVNGLMRSTDKVKLDGIEEGANNYTLPDELPASMITEDETHQFVTSTDKIVYADKFTKAETRDAIAKATPIVTTGTAGLMTAADKAKLDGIAANANKYVLPSTLPASMITEDVNHRFVTDQDKSDYADKYTKVEVEGLINAAKPEIVTKEAAGLMSASDKAKLDGIEANANKYVLPKTLPATMITEDKNHHFVTDLEKTTYLDKYTKVEVEGLIDAAKPDVVTEKSAGLMSASDKAKLDGIAANANNYVLPSTLPASMITEDVNHRFVTDSEKASYIDKYTKSETTELIDAAKPGVATQTTNGLMTFTDKAKLDGIAANANNYVLPDTLPASMITEDETHKFVTTDEKTSYADKYTKTETTELINTAKPGVVTQTTNGLMAATDKVKLDGIAEGANNYVLPDTLPASMITEDDTHKFVTTEEKTSYSDKYTKAETQNLITTSIQNANTDGMIWQKDVDSFNDIATTYPNPKKGWTVSVNDTGKIYRYNGTEWISLSGTTVTYQLVTSTEDGLMAATDKVKLDGIEANANNYVLPSTLPASMITTTDEKQFISSTEKTSYADKYTKAEVANLIKEAKPSNATTKTSGLMSADDKAKLDGIAANANKYVLPDTLPASMITEDETHKFVTTDEKTSYADKYTKTEVANLIKAAKPSNATTATAGLMSAADKAKLDGIEANANRYTLPSTIPASMVETSDDLQFVSHTEKTSYLDKYTKAETVNLINQHVPDVVTTKTNGLMIAADKVKLDGIEANANNYVLPSTLPASMITEDETHKFITTDEKTKIANIYTKDEITKIVSEATPSASDTKAGLMSAADKVKLDGIEANANNYTLPATLPASMITTTADKQFISNTEKTSYADKYTKAEVDQKLTNIASGNVNLSTYTRYKGNISAAQLAGSETYSGKIEKDDLFFQGNGLIIITKAKTASTAPEYQRLSTLSLVDSSSAGLMSAADKAKLDGIAAGANNYKLPSTLPASMITEDTSRQFVTPAEHTKLKNLANATTTVSGLMSSTDKSKLDGIEAGANNYVLPSTLPASMITEDNTHKFVTADEKTKLSQVYTKAETDNAIKTSKPSNATSTTAGLMSAADKAKLDGIAANANKYVLPSTLPASMIEQTDSLKFVSSAEKTKIGNTYTKTESDARYLTKVDSQTDKLEIGTGWEIKPNSDGNLEILYNGVVKTTISTDGKMLAPSIIEGSSLTGTGVASLNDLINTKEDKTSHDADINTLRTSLATKAASTDLNTKVYTRDSVTNNISSFPANTGIFLIEEPDTIIVLPS